MQKIKILIIVLIFNIWIIATVPVAATPITLRLANADITTVLRTLAGMEGVSLVVDDSVTGKITLQLEEMSFEQALEIITKAKGLSVQRIGNTLIVATPEKINTGFGSLQIIKLQYAKAEDVKSALGLIIPEDKIKVDIPSNSLLYSGTASETNDVQRAVIELDRQLAQVIIEAEVVEMNKDALKDSGLAWDWQTIPYKVTASSNSNDTSVSGKQYQSVRLFDDLNMGIAATINAKIENKEGKILARPRIMALNNKDAKIHIGQKLPVVEADNDGNKTVTYIEVGIKLDITPQISDNNTIISKVKTEVSDATYSQTAEGYEVSTRESETTVRLNDGQTLIIGGLYNSTAKKSVLKIPLLGDLPVFGHLFKSKSTAQKDTEIIVLLRPRIVKNSGGEEGFQP